MPEFLQYILYVISVMPKGIVLNTLRISNSYKLYNILLYVIGMKLIYSNEVSRRLQEGVAS